MVPPERAQRKGSTATHFFVIYVIITMIKPRQIYDATDNGLLIISMHYPDAAEAAKNNRLFKCRSNERTPSASVKLCQDKDGNPVWKMTDFGADGRMKNPIEIHMEECRIGFAEAIADLAVRFNVTDELNRSINRPDIRKKPATESQEDGQTYWEIDQEFTKEELAVMGPRVTAEHMKALHWYRVKCLISVKNREATYKSSNEHYPIFMRECWFTDEAGKPDKFYKIYEPLNVDKQWRFQYQPKGKKPAKYINGLHELRKIYTDNNERSKKQFYSEAGNEDKPFSFEKLPEAIICSGERDALCVRSLGYFPLWFNSETYNVSEEEWREINRYVNKVYNIPDIDSTGISRGRLLALQYIDLRTIWLPEKLSTYRDNRGRPRKDFRDYMDIWKSNSDFKKLLELGICVKFWEEEITEKKRGESVKISRKYSINPLRLQEFLKLHGFYKLKQKHSKDPIFIRIKDNVVQEITTQDIRAFVREWADEQGLPEELRVLILTTPNLSIQVLDALKEIDLDFCNYTPESQFFYFKNCMVEITGDKLTQYNARNPLPGRYVWAERVVPHEVNILPDMFEITHPEGSVHSEDFDIEIKEHNSNFFRYLINSSRLFWRKELEPEAGTYTPAETEEYKKAHKFDIAGPRLSEDEIREQKRCLISKIFSIGYLLHRYKRFDRPWSPFLMDNIIGANDQCNGRSGKSFMVKALNCLTNWVKLSGRNNRLLENNFVFKMIDKYTDIVVVDDCDEYFPFKVLYDTTSSDMTIKPKKGKSYTLNYNDAPKFAYTTNYVPREFDPPSRERQLLCVFSDYYHEATKDNDYLETRRISTDFGGRVLLDSTYPEKNWEQDLNFMMQCCKFYLSLQDTTAKIEPSVDNIIFRKHQRDVSDNFRDWAENYFSEDSGNLDKEIVREWAYNDYIRSSGLKSTSAHKFSKMLKAFCFTCDYIDCLNPEEFHTSGRRILRRVEIEEPGKLPKKVQKEMIYVRSKREAERLKAANAPKEPTTEQSELPF